MRGAVHCELREVSVGAEGLTVRAEGFTVTAGTAGDGGRELEIRCLPPAGGSAASVLKEEEETSRRLAEETFADFTDRLPPSRRPGAAVRLGSVRRWRDGGEPRSRKVSYVIRACSSTIFCDLDPRVGSGAAWRTPWASEPAEERIPPAAEVCLGRGAVLALFIARLERAEAAGEPPPADPRLRVEVDPRAGDPRWVDVLRELPQPDPRESGRRHPLHPDHAPLPPLWRSDHWTRPAGALVSDGLEGLAVRFAGPAARPRGPAMLLENLTYLGSDPAAVSWLCDYSVYRDGRRRAGRRPVEVRLPHDLPESRLAGYLAPPRRAAVRDPLSGMLFGRAPALVTRLKAGEILP